MGNSLRRPEQRQQRSLYEDSKSNEESRAPGELQNVAPEAAREGRFEHGRSSASTEEGRAIDFGSQRRGENSEDCPGLACSADAVNTRTYR